ncbi:MAG: magnesium transporter [Epsilonproteobacteria bacterium]|nr:magnesium transporter [Campylobacterota bacterium]|tara:strand:+ start:63 stop:1415 length:1353 start_codon:yes stop_codon:yes gene_type:complete
MKENTLIEKIVSHIDEVIDQKTDQGIALWKDLLAMHPADSAHVCVYLKDEQFQQLFLNFSKEKQLEVFEELPDNFKIKIVEFLDDSDKAYIFKHTNIDDLTDLFDDLSDEELKKSLEVLHKKDRQKVLSLLKFPPDSAGGIMTIDVVTLMQDFTVSKAISLLQRLKPNVDLHRQIYVTDQHNKLVGYIHLEDLVTRSPQKRLIDLLRQVSYVAQPQDDQEEVAKKMVHYHMMTVPVVSEHHYLLGVIPEDKLIDVIQQEAIEDAQRMSGALVTDSYFDIPFFTLLYQRSFILALLLVFESITSIIVGHFESVLTPFLFMFFAMLVSTGGNTSGQISAIVIQGMSSGDINSSNIFKFLRQELMIGSLLAIILSTVAFIRVYTVHYDLVGSLIVSISLGSIVFISVLLGASFPIGLKKLGLDPAFSAGPFLATIMDILGIFIYCYIAYLALA